ncbi:hypothetical protein PEC106664_44370 [Pectobacterium carotovorum subsp. carotovorum]|nr:hypothetical protein PEC106664_44370 [Pectobacterium carotovorum subsp. carotovorum]
MEKRGSLVWLWGEGGLLSFFFWGCYGSFIIVVCF